MFSVLDQFKPLDTRTAVARTKFDTAVRFSCNLYFLELSIVAGTLCGTGVELEEGR